jgi:hypothetical protein
MPFSPARPSLGSQGRRATSLRELTPFDVSLDDACVKVVILTSSILDGALGCSPRVIGTCSGAHGIACTSIQIRKGIARSDRPSGVLPEFVR